MHFPVLCFSRLLKVMCLFLVAISCYANHREAIQTKPEASTGITVTIDPAKTYQTIEHFGASDAWACQFVGLWPDKTRNAIADLLFSNELLPNGQPKGIGLSLWRFNIGAGTAEQGPDSGIRDEWRRAESFLNPDGSYNWDKQAGQVWFLKAAKQRRVAHFLAFSNSPPIQYTVTGKGYASKAIPNLNPDKFDQYAGFLANVLTGIRNKAGITFDYISPVNEPQWDWSDGGQEGTPFTNNQIAGLTRSLSAALLSQKLPTKISIAEAGQLDFLYSENKRPGKGNQINGFFDKTSPDFIGNVPNLAQAISAHSYFTTSPYSAGVQKRQQLVTRLADFPGLGYWMSEYCILGDNAGEIDGNGRDLGINSGLYVAKVIHNDLVNANASAWHWWTAISPYNYKDGLIYIDKNKTDGHFQSSKMLWAFGNFSRFIRPGAVRVSTTIGQTDNELLVSSYKNTNRQLVTVIINTGSKSQTIKSLLAKGSLTNVTIYTTSATTDLAPTSVRNYDGSLTIGANSIVTVVGKLAN